MPPGQSHTEAMRVVNNAEEAVHIRAWPADWFFNDKDAAEFIVAGKRPEFSCGSWTKVSPTEFDVPPHGEIQVRYTVIVPPNTPEGGYHCGVVVETAPPPQPQLPQTGLRTLFRFVNIIYVTIGDPQPEGQLLSLDMVPVSPKSAHAAGSTESLKPELQYCLEVRNSGITHFRVTAKIELRDSTGKAVEEVTVSSQAVLPKTNRIFKIDHVDDIEPGNFHLVATVDIGRKGLLQAERDIQIEPPPAETKGP